MGARHIAWRQERRMHATDSKQCIRAANEMDSTSIGLCPQGVRILSVSKLPLQGSATEKWLPQPWRMHCIRQLSLRGFDRRGGVIWGRGGGRLLSRGYMLERSRLGVQRPLSPRCSWRDDASVSPKRNYRR